MTTRRIFLATALCAAGLLRTWPAVAEGSSPLGRSVQSLAGRSFQIPGFPSLAFRTALPTGMIWENVESQVADFVPSGMFNTFRRLWRGRHASGLEVEVFAAGIPVERVALASDYARLLAMVWGPTNHGVDGAERDFGEVMTGDSEGRNRLRISIWRRGLNLLIMTMRSRLESLPQTTPLMATLVGSLRFEATATDPIVASLVTHHLPLSGGAQFDFSLPAHWPQSHADQNRNLAARVHLDEADSDRSGAIGLFAIPVPADAPPDRAPLRQIATATSELMLENLLPDAVFEREQMSEERMTGFDATPVHALLGDMLRRGEGPNVGAMGFFIRTANDVVGYSALMPSPIGQAGMARMMHVNFVQRLVINQLRDRFGHG